MVRFGNGAPGTIIATTAAYPDRPETICIIGTDAVARMAGGGLSISRIDGVEEVVADESDSAGGARRAPNSLANWEPAPMAFRHDAHRDLISDFIDAIEDEHDPVVTGEEALASQRLVDATPRKAREP